MAAFNAVASMLDFKAKALKIRVHSATNCLPHAPDGTLNRLRMKSWLHGAGLNNGRVHVSSILAVWISMLMSSNMVLSKTSWESTALLLFTAADVSALRVNISFAAST